MAIFDVYRLVLSFRIGPNFAQTTVHFEVEESDYENPGERAKQLAGEFDSALGPDLRNCLADNVELIFISAARVNSTRGPTGFFRPPLINGNRPSGADMPNSGPVLLFSGRGIQRWVSGRMFLPGIPRDDVEVGVIKPALFTLLDTLAQAIHTTPLMVGGVASHLCIWSEFTPEAIPVVSGLVSAVIGTQRGRLRPMM